jgi:hypothetical protein
MPAKQLPRDGKDNGEAVAEFEHFEAPIHGGCIIMF